MRHSSSTCATKNEGHKVDATRVDIKGGGIQQDVCGMTDTKVRRIKLGITNSNEVIPNFYLLQ